MKFTKFGKALLMSALSAGVVLSVSSCVRSYTVGFLYVTGTQTSTTNGTGIINGMRIDHNTGQLTRINGMPVASGGANPVRAVLTVGSRFLYVLNRGTTASGGSNCTTADPCKNANITQFAVGPKGFLTVEQTYYTQGLNPFRLAIDSSSTYLYVLEHDTIGANGTTPATAANPNANCATALGTGVTTCGAVTAFKIDGTTGRLSLLTNTQASAGSASTIPYFPVPANPVDFLLAGNYILTLTGSTATSYPYTKGTSVFPYNVASGNGQLTISQNSTQPLSLSNATHLYYGNSYVYVLANESLTVSGKTYPSQIVPYSIGTNGALQAQTGGAVADEASHSNPVSILIESKAKWAYVANEGNSTDTNNTQSGIAGYMIDPTTKQLTTLAGSPWGSGAGPQCMVEDPSNQFLYTANYNDSTVTGRLIDQSSGQLKALTYKTSVFPLDGPATWCVMNGRTD